MQQHSVCKLARKFPLVAEREERVLVGHLLVGKDECECGTRRRGHIHRNVYAPRLTFHKGRPVAVDFTMPHRVFTGCLVIRQEIVGARQAELKPWFLEKYMLHPAVEPGGMPFHIVNRNTVQINQPGRKCTESVAV